MDESGNCGEHRDKNSDDESFERLRSAHRRKEYLTDAVLRLLDLGTTYTGTVTLLTQRCSVKVARSMAARRGAPPGTNIAGSERTAALEATHDSAEDAKRDSSDAAFRLLECSPGLALPAQDHRHGRPREAGHRAPRHEARGHIRPFGPAERPSGRLEPRPGDVQVFGASSFLPVPRLFVVPKSTEPGRCQRFDMLRRRSIPSRV